MEKLRQRAPKHFVNGCLSEFAWLERVILDCILDCIRVSLNTVLGFSVSESPGIFANTAGSTAPKGGTWAAAFVTSYQVCFMPSKVWEPDFYGDLILVTRGTLPESAPMPPSTSNPHHASLPVGILQAHLDCFLLTHRLALPHLILLVLNLASLMVWQVTSKRVDIITLPRNHFQKQVEISSAASPDPRLLLCALQEIDTQIESAFCIITAAQRKKIKRGNSLQKWLLLKHQYTLYFPFSPVFRTLPW